MKFAPRENEEPSDWYGAMTLEGVPDSMFFATGTSSSPLDRYECRHLGRLVRRLTGDADANDFVRDAEGM